MKIELEGVGEIETGTVLKDSAMLRRILAVPGAMRSLQRLLNINNTKPEFNAEALQEAVKLSIFQIESRKSDIQALREVVGM